MVDGRPAMAPALDCSAYLRTSDRPPASTQIPYYWETRQDCHGRQHLAAPAIDHGPDNGNAKPTFLQCALNPFAALGVMYRYIESGHVDQRSDPRCGDFFGLIFTPQPEPAKLPEWNWLLQCRPRCHAPTIRTCLLSKHFHI